MELGAVDRRILDALQRHGRLQNVELAKLVGLSPSPWLRRVRLLEEAGVIERYVALLNPAKVGLRLTVYVQVWLTRQDQLVQEAKPEHLRQLVGAVFNRIWVEEKRVVAVTPRAEVYPLLAARSIVQGWSEDQPRSVDGVPDGATTVARPVGSCPRCVIRRLST
jgi:DNA-binding Lrp family transcriptional regulator